MPKGDNLFSCSTLAIDVKTGQIKWHYQGTPNDGWDFDGVNEFVTFDLDGKRVGGKADRNGFFYVIDANEGKLLNAFPFVRKITWASGIDLKTGRPNYIESSRRATRPQSQDGKKGTAIFNAPSFLGGKNQMPMAYSPRHQAVLRARQRVGHGDLERAGGLQEGRGLSRRGLHDQDHQRRLHRRAARDRPEDRQDRLGGQGHGAAVGRRADHRRQPRVLGYPGRVSEGRGREDGQGAVVLPDRPPASWRPRSPGNRGGEQFVGLVSGWGGAVPLWGGEVAKKVNMLEQGGMVWVFKIPKARPPPP